MRWRCADCGRTHDEPPGTCACGSADVDPADVDAPDDSGDGRFSLLAARRRLLEPTEADRSIVAEDPRVVLAFRVLLLVSLVVLLGLVVASLV